MTLAEIARIAMVAYFDGLDLFKRMWRCLLAIALLLIAGTISGRVPGSTTNSVIGQSLIATLTGIAALYFCAPFLVALVHSVVEDRSVQVRQFRRTEETKLYFAWGGLLALAFWVPDLVAALVTAARAPTSPPTTDEMIVGFSIAVIAWIVAVRIVTLLPGVAIEGRQMTLRRALQSTRGRFWLITGAFLLTSLAPGVGLAALFGLALMSGTVGPAATMVLSALLMLALIPLVILASVIGFALSVRLYQRYATDS